MTSSTPFKVVGISIDGLSLEYASAHRLADLVATDLLDDPMLIAWYDGVKNEEHPDVPECQHKPGWLAYAEGHGGKLQVNINQNQFSFVYASVDSHP